jgi:hypothetical protein
MVLITFYVSFILIVTLLATKYFDIHLFQHRIISNIVADNEKHVHTIIGKSKDIGSQIHFENFQKLTVKIVTFTKQEIIHLKRKFDSKQPKFFLKPQKPNAGGKHSVSFFLKNISDHKDSLKEKNL